MVSLTQMLPEVNPTGSAQPSNLYVFKGHIYFSANNGVDGFEVWRVKIEPVLGIGEKERLDMLLFPNPAKTEVKV